MKKIIVLILMAQTIFAYESYSTDKSKWKTFGYSFEKICVDNVFYIKSSNKLSVWINPKTLKPENCKGL